MNRLKEFNHTAQVDEDIPLPRRVRYPWVDMAVGDSFLAKNTTLRRICSTAYAAGLRMNMKFRVATVPGGFRVWRVR